VCLQLRSVQERCAQHIAKHLEIDTVFHVLAAAEAINAVTLMRLCIRFAFTTRTDTVEKWIRPIDQWDGWYQLPLATKTILCEARPPDRLVETWAEREWP
jgi:hypothetical protein